MDQPCPRCPASPSELRRGIGRFVGVGNRGMLLVFGLPRSGAVGERSRKVCALCRARHNAANSTLSLWPMPRLAPSARNDSLLFPGQRHPVFPASDRAARIRFLHSVRSRLDSRSWVLIGPDWPGFTDPPFVEFPATTSGAHAAYAPHAICVSLTMPFALIKGTLART